MAYFVVVQQLAVLQLFVRHAVPATVIQSQALMAIRWWWWGVWLKYVKVGLQKVYVVKEYLILKSVLDCHGQITIRSSAEYGMVHRCGYSKLFIFCCICDRLQDEYAALQKELKSTVEDSHLVQEKYTKLLDDARSQLSAKIAENEQLMTQVLA